MSTQILDLAQQLIQMRREPVAQALSVQYPALVAEFADLIAACTDLTVLEQVVLLDTGFFLPTMPRQYAFEQLVTAGTQNPAVLKQYLLHLAVFGFINDRDEIDPSTDAKMDALEAALARLT